MAKEPSADALKALFALLSARQLEVLRLLASHQTAKEIARAFGRSEYTVRAHATEARKRLGADTLREALILLARFDAQSGLVPNWQSQPEGMAPVDVSGAGWPDEQSNTHPRNDSPPDEDIPGDPGQILGNNATARLDDGQDRRKPKGDGLFVGLYARLQTLTTPRWFILLGVSTLLVLMITVGILAGAGALLQTIQDLGVRAR
ncbi:response regulator transcription factor [Asticcacaulis sp.]|uniref:response regulator transcription factor n=1 Tax=Asticcacaulis sp. TaxID=1872648 RepID=UPI003F7BCB8D